MIGKTTQIILNKEVDDIIKIVKFLEASCLLIKTIGNETEEQKRWICWDVIR